MKRYSGEVAEVIENNIDKAAEHARDFLASQEWIPDAVRPHSKPPPTTMLAGPSSLYETAQNWVSRHKIWTGVIVLTTGVIIYRGYRKSKYCRKTRRAKRARNGARLEVVVIAGSPNLPLTRSLSLDLERRGFIVYIACNTIDDEVLVQNLSRPDIKPLGIDITDVSLAPRMVDHLGKGSLTPFCSLRALVLLLSALHNICKHHMPRCRERSHTASL